MDFHRLSTQVKMFLGGNQSGKTTAGLADDLIQVVDRDLLPPHLAPFKRWEPPVYCRILTETNAVLATVIIPKMRELLPKAALLNDTWEQSYDKILKILRLGNGSTIQFMTYEQEVSAMGGVTLHRVHYDEEPPKSVRVENRTRLVKYRGDEIFTMTPLHGLSWAYQDLWLRRGHRLRNKEVYINEDQELSIVCVDMDDNPYLGGKAKTQVLRGLSKEEIDARKR